ncbi:SRPBCC domain-containing protein [Longispora sp. K20-0274]|uniref:SRPBCC domain-containing protein n=1 Tax=Longispora sp. K20-0274 TaxID=3088255 RepID=UPI00399C4159
MSTVGTATATVEVACDPQTAFEVFTRDIGAWWKRGTYYWNDAERGVAMRFEPHVGGRLVEVYDAASGEGMEIGRISTWEPGKLLVFGWRTADWPAGASTEVAVSFEATGDGTRVVVEHSGWDALPDGAGLAGGYTQGWAELLGFFGSAVR